jgi:hypothetical protein
LRIRDQAKVKMRLIVSLFVPFALAARPFLEAPDTGLAAAIGDVPTGSLPGLDRLAGLPDFQLAAENFLPLDNYTYYRNAAGGEWSYRNNLEVYQRYTLRPRRMVDVRGVENTLSSVWLSFRE